MPGKFPAVFKRLLRLRDIHRAPRGLSLLELLAALAASMILVGGVSTAFILVTRAADEAEAVVRAHASARSAVDAIARDLRLLQLDANPAFQQLELVDIPLAYGDFVDNDRDGNVDDQFFDGSDFGSSGLWSGSGDLHAQIGAFTERGYALGHPDWGDAGVGADTRFSADEVSFIVPAGVYGPQSPRQRITYRLGEFDGVDNVLLRIVSEDPSVDGVGDPVLIEPVVFDVMSLDILAWNANNNNSGTPGNRPFWTSEWDATVLDSSTAAPHGASTGTVPPFKFPASFLIAVTVNAERVPLSEIPGWPLSGQPVKTVRIDTIVNVESVIQDPRYDAFVRD